jgi:succinate dehydrogenase / fumarate reductase, cytochrome b subunit
VRHHDSLGRTSSLVHRWTGLAILAYLYLHLAVLGLVLWPGGVDRFNLVLRVLQSPPTIAADLLLFAIVLFHATNGVRLTLAELGLFIRHSGAALWAAMAVAAILLFLASAALWPVLLR